MVEGTISNMVKERTSATRAVVMPWCGISDHTTDDKHITAGIIAPNLGGVAINPAIVVLSRFRSVNGGQSSAVNLFFFKNYFIIL